MSLRQKPTKGIPYWLFTAGREKTIHLGPVNDPSKINPEKVMEAIDYVRKKYGHYTGIEYKLIAFLPSPQKEQYISKHLKELEIEQKYLLSLSPSVAKQYKPEGLVKADEETRFWQLEEEIQKRIKEGEDAVYSLKLPREIIGFDQLCDTIISLDPQILSVAVFNRRGKVTEKKSRAGHKDFLPNWKSQQYFMQRALSILMEKDFDDVFGSLKYNFSNRANLVLMAFPLQDYFLFVVTSSDINLTQLPRAIVYVTNRYKPETPADISEISVEKTKSKTKLQSQK